MHSFYNQFIKNLKQFYPSAPAEKEKLLKCVSPFKIKIPSPALSQIRETVKAIDEWSQAREPSDLPETSKIKIKNRSVLMAYDFHLDAANTPRLIEINTNASGFLVTDLIQKTHGLQTDALKLLKQSFFQEWNLFSGASSQPSYTAIIDENINEQKMKFEFFMYQDLMNSWGWKSEVLDIKNLKSSHRKKLISPNGSEIDFIYNRLTDFYFKKHSILKQAYERQTACFSPNPREYAKLADKRNLCLLYDWSKNSNHTLLKNILIPSELLKDKTKAWADKKTLFFKPVESYGGKGSYTGKTITKKKFSELKNYIAQERIPPKIWEDPLHQDQWKFDIRAYAYQDEVQLIGGRIYKGQLTNFQNPYGGFFAVEFV